MRMTCMGGLVEESSGWSLVKGLCERLVISLPCDPSRVPIKILSKEQQHQ